MNIFVMRTGIIIASLVLLTACGQPAKRNNGVYMLLDTSGTYREELQKAEQIIYFTLSRLGPTDSFAVARIDTGSFIRSCEKDIIVKSTFEDRPSAANGQKRQFAERVGEFRTQCDIGAVYRHHRWTVAGD